MKTVEEIRQTLRDIRLYYKRPKTFEEGAIFFGKPHPIIATAKQYTELVENAPKRLREVYESLYVQGNAQKVMAIDLKVTEKYIQILNKRLIVYLQGVVG